VVAAVVYLVVPRTPIDPRQLEAPQSL
jgi:hypothetical protein